MTQQRITAAIPHAVWFLIGGLVVLGAIGPNFLLSLFGAIVLLAGVHLLWRPGESPIFLWVFAYQWLQASIKTLQANTAGLNLSALANYGGDIETASYLSLLGLLLLAIGMHWGAGRQFAGPSQAAGELARRHSMVKWFKLYVLAFGVSSLALVAARQVPALAQPLLALAGFKWAFFFMLTYAAFVRPFSERRLWLLAFVLEFLLGFGGYFSGFTKVLFFSLMGVFAAGVRFKPGKVFALTVLGTMCLAFGILWTAVKVEYRSFVSGGEVAQIVSVDYAASLAKLGGLVANLDQQKLGAATEQFVSRITYVDFFGSTVEHVPNVVPHTYGAIWLDAISRPFTPRLLFPSKSEIHDSDRTNKYSGVLVAGADQGTSISIGYMGESYIDFGAVLMMLPILGLGWFFGRIYRWLVTTGPSRGLLGMGLASAALFTAALLESSITKVFGGLMAALLVAWLLNRFIFPRYLSWLMAAPIQSR